VKLETILETVKDERFPGAVIPRFDAGVMRYYAVTETLEQWRRLVPILKAAIGSTITDFKEQMIPFDEEDPLGLVLIENGYSHGALFTAANDTSRGRYALSALARLRNMVYESAVISTSIPRATGEVLRSFELGLASFDRSSAEESLAFLRTNLRLDAINLGFLTVRLHATFQEWESICRLKQFPSLCKYRRTAGITNLMAEAVYRTRILEFEQDNDPQQAIDVFRDDILTTTGTLFDACPPNVSFTAGKAFLLSALTSTPPNRRLVSRLTEMSSEWPEEDAAFFHRLANLNTAILTPSESIKVRPEPGEDDIAILRNETEAPTLERAKAGLITAMQLETLDASQAVVAYVSRLEFHDREELLKNTFMSQAFEHMENEAGGKAVPKNWVEWMSQLKDVSISESQEFAKRATEEWRVHDQLATEAEVSELTGAISRVPSDAQDRLFDTFAHMVQWLQHDDGWPEKYLLPLYRSIYDHLMLQLADRWWLEASGTARELLDGMMQLGLESGDYADLLGDMASVLPPEAGVADFDFLMELAELTIVHSSQDPNSRQQLWARIVGALSLVRTRLSRGDLSLVNDLGQVFGMPEVFPLPEIEFSATEPNLLDGKLIAIYTLSEQVGIRARQLLMNLYLNVEVELCHEKVDSTRVEGLARTADIFVICWRSAAHAATEAIKRHRPEEKATLYSAGKGSTSILRAIDDHLKTYALALAA
jgi:hypothetical protein